MARDYDKNGHLLQVGVMVTVDAHGGIPWFRGEVQELHDDYVAIGYDNDVDGDVSWDCDYNYVELD